MDMSNEACVERGYQWLLAYGPAYGCDIDRVTEPIAMHDVHQCVLAQSTGQEHNGFDDVMHRVFPARFLTYEDHRKAVDWIYEHGFSGGAALVPVWEAKLAEHRAGLAQVNP